MKDFMTGLAGGINAKGDRVAGLISGMAGGYNAVKDNEAYNRGIAQINSGDWEGGVNTIAERNPEVALGLAQYKQKQDDAMNMAQMKIAADMQNRNTLTPYQQEMLALKRMQLAQANNPDSDPTGNMKDVQFLVGQGYSPEDATKMVFNKSSIVNPFDKKRMENIGKEMDKNIAASQSRVDDYNRMEQLLNDPEVITGGAKGAFKDSLPDFALDAKTAELRSIIKKIVPQMRPAGSGTTSDRDMKIFEQATVGLGKDKEANLNIVRGRKIVDENNIAKEELRYEWVNNGGNLGDFDKAWRQYLNANPIFENKSGALNKNRQDAYSWFSRGMQQPQTSQADYKSKYGLE